MNRNYKVIWNASLNCFMAVAEYAKARGKSSKSSVSSNATINTTSTLSSTSAFKLTAIGLGLMAAGFCTQASAANPNQASGTLNHHAGTFSHSHGSHGVHQHSPGNNSHTPSHTPNNSGSSLSLNFEGDNDTTITRTNGETLYILGGAALTAPLTTGNIGVFGVGDTLHIQLAEDLTGLNSAAFGSTLVDTSGITITNNIDPTKNVTLTSAGLNNGGNQITNVASGGLLTDPTNQNNAATIGDIVANQIKYVSINSTGGTNEDNLGAQGADAIAIGKGASAVGQTTVAIGLNSGAGSTAYTEQGVSVGNASGQNVLSSGNVGIGRGAGSNVSATPRATVGGNGNPAYRPYSIEGQNTAIGADAGNGVYGDSNSALGERAGRNVDGHANTAIGAFSGNAVVGSANVAMGPTSGYTVTGDRNTAVGNFSGSHVVGKANSAFGNGAGSNVTGEYNLALGATAGAGITNNLSIAIGNNAGNIAKGNVGESSISVGTNSSARGLNSMAIGRGSVSAGINAIGIGVQSIASATGAIAVGHRAEASGENAIAIGKGSLATGSQAIGVGSRAGNGGAAYGDNADAGGTIISATPTVITGTAIGNGSIVNVDNGVALGSKSVANRAATGSGVVFTTSTASPGDISAINNTRSTVLGAVSVGNDTHGNRQIVNVAAGSLDSDAVNVAQLKGVSNAIAVNKTKYYSVKSNAVGNADNLGASGPNAMAMGGNASATGGQAIAIGSGESGQNTTASGQQSIAIGANVKSSGNSSIAIGGDDLDEASVDAGTMFTAYTGNSLIGSPQYGEHTESSGAASVAIGVKARSQGKLSTAVGVRSSSSGDASSAFGMGSSANAEGSVALGAGSVANRAGGMVGYVPTGISARDALAITNTQSGARFGAVSVGTGRDGGNRQIVNLAAGSLDSDAVNVAQLKGGISSVVDLGLNFTGDNAGTTVNRKLGEKLIVKGGESDATKLASGNNIGVVASSPDTLTVKLAKDLTGLTSVTTGNTVMNTSGVSFTGSTVKLSGTGLNNGGNQITNVLSGGTTLTNAANIGDVNSAAAGSRTEVVKGTNVSSVNKTTGSNGQDIYTVNANGTTASAGSDAVTVTPSAKNATTNLTDYKVDLSTATKTSLSSADSALQSVVTQIDGTAVKTITKANNTANFLNGDNILLTDESGSIKVALAKDLTGLTSVTTGNTVMNTSGITLTGGMNQTVTLSNSGLNNGGNQITNVKAGTEDMDAVNVGQLNLTNTAIDKGLNFGGDSGTDVNRKLGQKLIVKGGDTINADPATKNISVTANGDDTLTVRLAKDINLGETGSVTTGNTQVNNAGITLYRGDNGQVVLTNNGLNNGGNQITNVLSGGETLTNAANIGDVKGAVGDIATKGLDFAGNDGINIHKDLGQKLEIVGTLDASKTASAKNIRTVANNGKLEVQLADALDVTSVTTGNAFMNNTGFTFVGNGLGRTVILSSSGLDNGGNIIRNVGTGLLNSDAVNVGQLRKVTIALDQGWGITAQGDIATMVKQGGSVDMNSRDGNIKVSRSLISNAATLDSSTGLRAAAIPAGANDLSFDLNPDLTVDSLTTGDTTINSNGLTIVGGPSVTKSGIDAADKKNR